MNAAVSLIRRTYEIVVSFVSFAAYVWSKNVNMTCALFPLSLAHVTVYLMILYEKQRLIDGIYAQMGEYWAEVDMVLLNAIDEVKTFATNCVAISYMITVLTSKLKQAYQQINDLEVTSICFNVLVQCFTIALVAYILYQTGFVPYMNEI